MNDEQDTDIDNYNTEELLDIINLNEDNTVQEIEERIEELINRYEQENNYKYYQFFVDMKDRLLNIDNLSDDNIIEGNTNINEGEEEGGAVIIDNQATAGTVAAPNTNVNQAGKITTRDNLSLFPSAQPVQQQQQLGVNNNIPLTVAQDTLNPTLRQTTTRTITIDSQFRNNTYPVSFNPNATKGTDTNFTCTLSESIQNVLSITLESVNIPRTYYTYDSYIGNTKFWIYFADSSSNFVTNTGINSYRVQITEGNYNTLDELVTEINESVQECVKDVSLNSDGSILLDGSGNPSITYDLSGLRCCIRNSNTNNKTIGFLNYTPYFIKLFFYPEPPLPTSNLDFSGCSNLNIPPCTVATSYHNNLGYYLGYRILNESTNSKPVLSVEISPLDQVLSDISYTISETWAASLKTQYFAALLTENDISINKVCKKTIEALILANTTAAFQAPSWPGSYTVTTAGKVLTGFAITEANIGGPSYFQLILDDFNQSYANAGAVGIATADTRLDFPSFYNKIPQDTSGIDINSNTSRMCYDVSQNNSTYLPTFPRKVTQAQLYALNEIIANRRKSTDVELSPNNANLFANLYLPLSTAGGAGGGQENLITYQNKNTIPDRKYFGPITLDKLGIKLIDNKGNTVNLHGHSWTFTLSVEILYQY